MARPGKPAHRAGGVCVPKFEVFKVVLGTSAVSIAAKQNA